jgi:hypothetical protein
MEGAEKSIFAHLHRHSRAARRALRERGRRKGVGLAEEGEHCGDLGDHSWLKVSEYDGKVKRGSGTEKAQLIKI